MEGLAEVSGKGNGFLYIQLQENILFISFYICISFFNLLKTFWINHNFGASMSAWFRYKTEKGVTVRREHDFNYVLQLDICNFALSKIIKFKNIEGRPRMYKLNY